jgi:hypothetical protein
VIENTNHSRLRALDDGERQRPIDRKRRSIHVATLSREGAKRAV